MPTIQDMNASTVPMPEGYGLAATTQDKITTLDQKRQEKIAYLGANKQYANLDESMTVMPGGNLESNRNKVWNNMDAVGVQDMLSDAADQSLTRDPNTGKVYYNKTGQEYTGELERAYMYGTKANDGSVKFGLARGDLPSSDYRYQPGRAAKEGYNVGKNGYGWDAGPDGVDTSKNYMDMLLPKNVATALEGAIHGNSNALANRKYPDYLSDESLQHASGVSEYYKSAEGMLGDTSKLTAEQIRQGDTSNLADYSKLQGTQGKQYTGKQQQALTDEQWNRILGKENVPEYNIARGMGSATLNVGAKVASLIGEGAESAGQVLGVKGLEGAGTAAQEAATKFQMENTADKMTGYDSKNAQELQTEIGDTIKKDGYLAALGKAVTDSRSLEVLATSVPEMVALAASVGTMAIANANNNINIGEKAAGREFTAEEKALSAVTSIVSTYLDRAGDKLALGGMNGAKQALKTAVEKAPASVQEALVSKWGKGILTIGEAPLRLAGAGAVEGGTEYLQTLGEKAAQDPEVFKAGFNEKALDEADVAGVLGAAMGTHMATPKVVKDTLVGGSYELSPEQKEVLEKPEQVKASKDEFFAKVQKAKEDMLDESHYRNRGELKNIATEFMNGSDKSGILASDDDTHTKLEKVKELVAMVAEDGELTAEHKQKLVERLTDQLGMDSKHIEASLQEAEDTGNAIRALKTAKDVDNEVTTGPRGFVTYYNNAVTAMQNGDKETLAKNIENLGKFIQSQETKRGRLAGAEEEVLKEYNAKVQMLMDAEGLNEAAAGKKVYQEWAKDRNNGRGYVSVAYSDAKGVKPFELFKSQVIENKVAEANGKEYEFGGYAAIKGIERSIEAMKQLYGQLEGNASVREGVPEVTKKWVDEKIASGVKPEQLVAGIQASDKLTANQKAAAVGYIKESKGEELPTPREVAEAPLDEKASKEPEGNFTTQDESDTSFEDVEGDFTTPDDINMNYEEPDMDFTTPDDVNMNFEEPNEEYVGMDEVNQVFGEPEEGNFTTDDVVTRNPGEKRSKKDVIELKGDSKLVAENREILDTLRRKLDKLRAEGKSESAEAKKAKGLVEKLQVTMDRLIAGSPLHKLLNESRSTMSSAAKNLREVFTVGKATPLNAEVVKANEEAVKLINEVIKKPTLTGKKVVDKQDSLDDPGRALLFNNDGSVNGNVATALWKAMNDYVATSAGALANGKTFEQVGKMFPNLEVEATIDMLVHLNEGGDLLKFEAEKVGADVMKLLGIVPSKKEVSSVEVQGMKASLGMMTIRMAEGKGLVKIGSVNPYGGDATIPMLYIGKEFKNGLDNALDESEKYASYDTPDVPKKSYSFNKIVRDDVEVHNQPYTDVTPLQKAMKQELDQLAFKVNSGAEVLLEMYGDNPEALKDVLGRTSDEDLEKMSYDGKKAAESVNREIETKVDGFFEMLKDAKEGDGYKEMFFEWFVTKGGRTNSYATVVDPQSDKQLARWLVTTEGSRKELTRKDIDENTDAGVGFKYGLVQAFDGVLPEKVEIDKSSRAKVIDMADRLLAMSDEELKVMVEGSEHLGHALLGLANIRKARATKFESDLVMEMDGLTNGLSFKFVQFPTNEIMELLPKVGVVLEGTKEFAAETIAEVKDKDKKFGEFADLYETVGTKLEMPVLKDDNKKLQELLKDVLPKLNDLKVVRNLAKPMVMVTGYNAGETSTKLAQVNELIGKLVEDIVSGKVENIGELEKLVKVGNLKGLLKKNSVVDPKLKPFREAMTKFYMEAYAEPMYKALADTIPGLVKVGSAVTSAYEYMYQVLVQEYDKKIAEFKQAPGQEQKIEIMRELLEKCGPIVRNSETVGKLDRVLALSRELVDMKEKINSNKGTEGAKNVQLVVRTFGKPGAAGGVLQTHTEDNHTMARTMMDASKKFNQVFDAMVLGVDQWSDVKGYNRNFYELNKEFSMLDAVIEALEMNMKLDEGGKIKVGTNSDVSGQNLLDLLKQSKMEIDGNRAKIFGSRAKIGQMVGTNGTMHEVNPKEELARIEDMKAKMKESLEDLGKGESLLDKKLLEIAKKMECK